MIDELAEAIRAYQTKWQKLTTGRADQAFFQDLKPTSVGWKVEDLADLDRRFAELRDASEQVHLGWVNERWLATLYLKEVLPWGLRVVKLMQRRPNSTDAVGLDHLDLLLPEGADAKAVLSKESDMKWTEEKNGEHCRWISIWFDDTEAKLRSDTVLEVCAEEMKDYEASLLKELT